MTPPRIDTPRGTISIGPNGKAELVWNTDFQPKWQRRFSAAQKFVDNEVLRLSEPYTPFRTGMLVKSSLLGTDVGSGQVSWIAPYARRQYYLVRKNPGIDPLRGSHWFDRMKAQHWTVIVAGARKFVGGAA